MINQTYIVSGMSCGGCAAGVKRALERKEGINEVTVDLAKGEVHVNFDDQKIQDAAIIALVTQLGYDAEVKA